MLLAQFFVLYDYGFGLIGDFLSILALLRLVYIALFLGCLIGERLMEIEGLFSITAVKLP